MGFDKALLRPKSNLAVHKIKKLEYPWTRNNAQMHVKFPNTRVGLRPISIKIINN